MARQHTDTPGRWTEEQKKEAYARAHQVVRLECPKRGTTWREDVAHDAFQRWLAESQGARIDQWVRWAIADASQADTRRERLTREGESLPDATPWAGSSNSEPMRSYTQPEEDDLRDAVRELCLAEYQRSWGKSWASATTWLDKMRRTSPMASTVRGFFAALSEERRAQGCDDIQAEVDAVAKLELVRARGVIPKKPPEIGGSAVATLWEIQKLVDAYDRARDTHGSGFLDESDLRRFVSSVRGNAVVTVMLGCTRPPGGDVSIPKSHWITTPDVDETTVLWLLAGGWPAIRKWPNGGITAKGLIRRMRTTVAAAVVALGPASPRPAAKRRR